MPLPSGAVFIDIDLDQVDKKSPVDDTLMTSIAEDLYFLKGGGASGTGGTFEFKVNGDLERIKNSLPFKRIDGAFVMTARTLTSHAQYVEYAGKSGTLETDMRKYRATNTPITGIDYQYTDSISSITRAGATSSTQSIARATTQVGTQSITYWKSQINIDSIILLGGGLVRYNLASAPDTDWIEGTDYVLFASCTSSANNGTFKIIERNQDGYPSIVISNPAGVAQTSAAGNVNLQAFSYNLTNPANAQFVAGEKADFNSHTSANNDGKKTIYAANSAGNNLIVKNQNGVTQGGVAGTIDVLRFTYAFTTAAPSDLVATETAFFSGHTSSANDGNLRLTAVNSGGNNVIAYNENGATQGGVAGSVDSNRWIYALPSDPSSSFSAGQTFRSIGATDFRNNGVFTVKQVNRLAANNLVTHNENGQTQGGSAGNLYHTRKIVKFSSDQSAIYATNSRVGIRGVPLNFGFVTAEHDVLQVNRGGGANYNIVIDVPYGLSQASPAGRVHIESRSIFSTRPSFTVTNSNQDLVSVQNGVLDTVEKAVAAGRMLCLDILQVPSGAPQNLTTHTN